jgi:hypothetical protein
MQFQKKENVFQDFCISVEQFVAAFRVRHNVMTIPAADVCLPECLRKFSPHERFLVNYLATSLLSCQTKNKFDRFLKNTANSPAYSGG